MTILTAVETKIALELFESGGHVLDFSNATYAAFFRSEVGVDIYDDAYAIYGTSKGKRLRAFCEKAQPAGVRKILSSLWAYRQTMFRISGETDPLIKNLPDKLIMGKGQPVAHGSDSHGETAGSAH